MGCSRGEAPRTSKTGDDLAFGEIAALVRDALDFRRLVARADAVLPNEGRDLVRVVVLARAGIAGGARARDVLRRLRRRRARDRFPGRRTERLRADAAGGLVQPDDRTHADPVLLA